MRPHRLRVQAFGAFAGTEEVAFDDLEGLFLLHGETGAGKTTLLDAIAFALYGRVPGERGSAKRLRSDHAATGLTTEVELEATIGGRRLRITRRPEQDRPKKSGTGFTKEQAAIRLDERAGAGRPGFGRGLVRQPQRGLQVRDPVDGDRPVLVGQHDRLREPGPVGPQVHAGRVDQRAIDPEPQRRVVVAADQDHPGAGAAEPGERVLAERDRVHRGDGPVIDVARDEDGVHPLGARGLDEVVEEFRLRLSQVGPVERPPEMPVRGMQEPHGRDSSEPLRHSGPELRC
jgi:energy-coupling factor transporter ATP-binding protein EcfA2